MSIHDKIKYVLIRHNKTLSSKPLPYRFINCSEREALAYCASKNLCGNGWYSWEVVSEQPQYKKVKL